MTEPIHVSEIKSYLGCRLKWFWSAPKPRGLNLEPKRAKAALSFGRMVHQALQVGYDTGRPFEEAFLEAADETEVEFKKRFPFTNDFSELEEQRSVGLGMMRGYQAWAEEIDEDVQFIATETHWEGPKLGKIPLAGRYDAIVKRPDGLWILDFKTTSFSVNDWVATDLQATTYVWAARKLYGPTVRGMLYRFLLKKAPQPYDQLILKNGTLTTRKGLSKSTTLDEFIRALAVVTLMYLAKESPELLGIGNKPSASACNTLLDGTQSEQLWYSVFKEQFELAKKLHYQQIQSLKGGSVFFWEEEAYRTDKQIEMAIKYVLYPAIKEMVSLKKNRWVGPTGLGASFAVCRGCKFAAPCKLVMDGAAYQEVLLEDFQERNRDEI